MSVFSSEDLYIVLDGHHFVFLAKDKARSSDHLIAFKKISYDPEKFAIKKRADPGRTFDRFGSARSSYSSPDLSKKGSINYLKEACKTIDSEFKQGNFSRITLIGNFESLTMMKKSMSKNMQAKIFREIYKNYSKMPVDALEKHLLMLESTH